jgi:hypothetical protein
MEHGSDPDLMDWSPENETARFHFLGELLNRAKKGMISTLEVRSVLRHMREEKLNEAELYRSLHILGEAGCVEALSDVEPYLRHQSSELRIIALNVIVIHWAVGHGHDELRRRFAQVCEDMFRHDQDQNVQRMAASCLSSCYAATNDERIGRLLAQRVFDDRANKYLREACYRGLFELKGLEVQLWPGPFLRFPEDVNREFVEAYLRNPSRA